LIMKHLIVSVMILLGATRMAVAEDDKKAEAEKYYRAGESAYNNGQYLAAADAFEEALELLPVPAIVFSTAQAYRLLYVGDKQPAYVKRAVELYHQYLAQQREGGRVPDATASLAELEPVLERLEAEGKSLVMPIKAPRTQLMISSQVDGAKGEVAGQTGTLPLIVEVAAGDYTVKVEAEGYFAAEQKATAVDGEFIVSEVVLQPKPAILDVRAEAGSRVEVDGRPVGATPLSRAIEVPAGKHFVAITRRGRIAFSREVVARRGETIAIHADLARTGQRKAVPYVWIGAGVLALASGAAGGYALVQQGKAEDIDAIRQDGQITAEQLDEYLRHRDRRDAGVTTMWVLAGASLITATVGTLMYIFDRPDAEAPPISFMPEPETGTSVSPFATADGAGAGLLVTRGF